ncbi:biopolymer transporter ExbD [bacterium]|nr:biopolymer transporter ExbD [bacterium]
MNQPITKIDITPLVSVALILVIIFVVTSPLIMTPADSTIQLPKARTIEAKSNKNIMVTVSKDLRIAVNEKWVKHTQLSRAVKNELVHNKERLVLIRADKNLQHQTVLELLHEIKRAGATHIALATEQKSRAQL